MSSFYGHLVTPDVNSGHERLSEIWAFVYAKEKNVLKDKEDQFGYGDVCTFTALDAESKLVPTGHIGNRDIKDATILMKDLARRLKNKVQLTTDGHKMYLEAVEGAFGCKIDFSQLVKIYGTPPEAEKRYSPAECIGRRDIR